MPNVGDIIRASDVAVPAGIVAPFHNVTLSGRYPIFWGETEPNTGWLVCDGGDDLHGGNVPNLSNRFIMGVTSVSAAKKTGGSTSVSGTIGLTTITGSTSGTHQHYVAANVRSTFAHTIRNTEYISRTNYNGGDGIYTEYTLIGSGTVASVGLTSVATGGSGGHTHSFSGTATPPYYSLIYLVKLPK